MQQIAKEIRKLTVECIASLGQGHIGGSLSIVDVLTVLYFKQMNVDVNNPKMEGRYRLVVSKGHAGPAVYATLCRKGYISHDELLTLNKFGTNLPSHCDMNKTPGVDMTTGSLGQGISCAVGMALANKLDKNDHRIYNVLGDGECQEGQVWEATMSAAHYKLDNLCIIVDNNNLQIDGHVDEVMSVYPLDKKFEAFNCHVINVDGHDYDQLRAALKEARETKGMPTVIVAKTIKGKGVSFMEDQQGWHGVAPNEEQYHAAMKELEAE